MKKEQGQGQKCSIFCSLEKSSGCATGPAEHSGPLVPFLVGGLKRWPGIEIRLRFRAVDFPVPPPPNNFLKVRNGLTTDFVAESTGQAVLPGRTTAAEPQCGPDLAPIWLITPERTKVPYFSFHGELQTIQIPILRFMDALSAGQLREFVLFIGKNSPVRPSMQLYPIGIIGGAYFFVALV